MALSVTSRAVNSVFSKRLGYVLFACLSFFLWLYLIFPAAALGERLVRELHQRSQGALQLSFTKISLWRLSGLDVEDVTLKRSDKPSISLPQIKARLRLLPLLWLRPTAYIQLPLNDGGITSTLTWRTDAVDVHVDIDAVDFAAPPLIAKMFDVPVVGTVSGTGELSLSQDMRHSTGMLALKADKVAVGPLSVQGLNLPQLAMGNLNMEMEMADGKARLSRFEQRGGVIEMHAQLKIELAEELAQSPFDACLLFKMDPQFLANSPKVRSVIQLAETQLKKDSQGLLNVPLSGLVASPQFRGGMCQK